MINIPGCSCDEGHDHRRSCPRGRLYEAAPALLEALERATDLVVAQYLSKGYAREIIEAENDVLSMRTAIRAAKGESNA